MPVVPVIDQPRVSSRPLGSPQVGVDTRGTRGEALAQGLGQSGQLAGAIGQDMARANAQAAAEAERIRREEEEKRRLTRFAGNEGAFDKARTELLYHPQTGVLAQQGANAGPASKAALERLEKLRDQLAAEGFDNEEDRARFTTRINASLQDINRQVWTHVAREDDKAFDVSFKTAKQEKLNLAAASLDDDIGATRAEMEATELIAAEARRRGLDAGGMKALLDEWKTERDARVIPELINRGDIERAQAMIEAGRERLGETAEKYARALGVKKLARDIDDFVGSTIESARIEGYPWLDPAKASDALARLPTEHEGRDEIRRAIEHEVDANQELRKEAGAAKLNELQSVYETTRNMRDPRITAIKAWMLDPPNGAAGLWHAWQRELDSEARARRAEGRTGKSERDYSDRNAITEFLALTPEQRAALDIDSTYLGETSKYARDRMRAYQNRAKEDVTRAGQTPEREFHQRLDVEAQREKFASNKARSQKFKAHMTAWRLRYLEEHKGEQPTREEFDRELGLALVRGDLGGPLEGALSPDRYRFEVEAEDVPSFTPRGPDAPAAAAPQAAPSGPPRAPAGSRNLDAPPGEEPIPAADRALIEQVLKKKRLPVTEAAIRTRYELGKRLNNGR